MVDIEKLTLLSWGAFVVLWSDTLHGFLVFRSFQSGKAFTTQSFMTLPSGCWFPVVQYSLGKSSSFPSALLDRDPFRMVHTWFPSVGRYDGPWDTPPRSYSTNWARQSLLPGALWKVFSFGLRWRWASSSSPWCLHIRLHGTAVWVFILLKRTEKEFDHPFSKSISGELSNLLLECEDNLKFIALF